MRIAFGGYEHETNTFSNLPVTAEQLERITLCGGQNHLPCDSPGIQSADLFLNTDYFPFGNTD